MIQTIHLNSNSFRLFPLVYMVQNDTGRELEMILDDFTLSGSETGTVAIKRSDGSYYSITATIDAASNSFTAEMDQALTQPGYTDCQLKVTDSNDDVISSYTFRIMVQPSTDGVSTEQLGVSPEELVAAAAQLTLSDNDVKLSLLQIAEKMVYIDQNGQQYYDALHDALYPPIRVTSVALDKNTLVFGGIGGTDTLVATIRPNNAEDDTVYWGSSDKDVAVVSDGIVTAVGVGECVITATCGTKHASASVNVVEAQLVSIDATYTQVGMVYDTDTLDSLKEDLVVTATWDNSTVTTVPSTDYTLSGTLVEGTSTITVSYGGKTDTFNVTVSSRNWTIVRTIGNNYSVGELDRSNGTVKTSSTGWYTSDFIEVPDDATIYSRITSRTSDWYLVWYDSEQTFIGNGENGTYSANGMYGGGFKDSDETLWNAVPVNAKYCRVSWRTNATYTSLTFRHITELDETVTPVVGKLYYYTYNPTSTASYIMSNKYLKCEGMAYAQIRPVTRRNIVFYDADFIQVGQISTANNIGNNVAIPSNAVYLKCANGNTIANGSAGVTLIGQRLIEFTDASVSDAWTGEP